MARAWGKKQAFVRPEGQVRRSQVISTFGPGAMVDLIDHAVLVGGLDFWSYDRSKGGKGASVLREPRLRDRIVQRGLKLSLEHAFREPPMGDTINIGTAINSQIQQGTTDSSQEMTVSEQTIGDIQSFLSGLKEELATLKEAGLGEDAASEIDAQMTIAEGQLASKKTRCRRNCWMMAVTSGRSGSRSSSDA